MTEREEVNELADVQPPYSQLLALLRDEWHIDCSWDGLRQFWNVELTDEGVSERAERDAAIAAMLRPEVTQDTSDGYHTFRELYHHRALLFSVVVRDHTDLAWKSKAHHDGTMYDDMFIVGIETPQGQATYHYDIDPYWEMFDCKEREQIINRLNALELSGGSHEMLSSIAKAISPDAMFGWTIGACNLLRARLVNLLSDDEAYLRGYDEGFASADDVLSREENGMLEEHGWVRLPVDADGVTIHFGDMVVDINEDEPFIVEEATLNKLGWTLSGSAYGEMYEPTQCRHYHAPTVEDVLRDMRAKLDEVTALYVGEAIDSDERDSDEARIFAEYAAKLRLAGDAE